VEDARNTAIAIVATIPPRINVIEGMWTGLRNFLPFRGVHKKYLSGYVAVHECRINLKGIHLLSSLLLLKFTLSIVEPNIFLSLEYLRKMSIELSASRSSPT
jgi:hypothetical protein